MKIESIVVGERVRKDMGDIESLAESIKRHGLLHPIVIKTDNTLVAGHRRLDAARSLGWNEIPVTVINVEDMLGAERDENAERYDLRPTEAIALGRLIEERERVPQDERIRRSIEAKRAKKSDGAQESSARRTSATEKAATAVGMAGPKYREARDVVSASEADPERFADIAAKMDETGNVHGAHEEMQRRKGKNGKNGRKPRHPVHHKMRYPKPNREVERATFSLDGICTCLQAIELSELDTKKTKAWANSLKKSAATIAQFARRIERVKT